MTSLWFEEALLPEGWAAGVRLSLAGGRIAALETGAAPQPADARYATGLPGLPNLHSHAFQRAMAGLAEAGAAAGGDDFWSWRGLMYRLAGRVAPADVEAIAAMAYVEMLEAGFTRVGEFHYVHHQPSGEPYDDLAEMAAAIASASETADIALTLLPVFYAHSDFGGAPPLEEQRRFVNDIDGFVRLFDAAGRAIAKLDGAVLGVAPHSLRAATPDELGAVIALAPSAPVHIHIAEQRREAEACLAWCGERPVAWLLDHADVDARWCLVHATHADEEELARIAGSGAVIGLCPITEADLGDGVFPAAAFAALGGRFGVGSDSNVRIDAAGELRLLEYGQRLTLQKRNVLAAPGRSTGRALFEGALAGGAQALGVETPRLAAGAVADIVSLKRDEALAGEAGDKRLDRWIFSRGEGAIDSVWRAGRQVVRDGRHVRRDNVAQRYAGVISRLLG